MKQKKIPMRRCLITREQYPKQDLVRVVVDKEQNVSIDYTGKKNGRGAYLKVTKENVLLAQKRRCFERELSLDNLDKIYEELLANINE
ncbi:MAG: RNase P modulator RnpM [Bacilli bacterium]